MTHYQLRWRKRFLAVRRGDPQQPNSLCLEQTEHLMACVQHSAIDRIRLDLDFDAETLSLWADAGQRSKKAVYLRLPSALGMPQYQAAWWLKRIGERLVALVIALAIAPVLLLLMAMVGGTSRESIFTTQWHVGERGRLFRVIKLRTQTSQSEWLPFGQWMWRHRLDRLPKIWHVVRGEMGLVGSCPKNLQDIAHLAKPWQYRLNALPGLVGAWQIEGNWMGLDERNLYRLDTSYLINWSPLRELKFLLLALPMVFSTSK
ncbi:MAG: sugar transferase [Alkalinema sp. RU_4_3]|nr:sugar transferase [Alkalinema sp. RU_4_3]